MRLSQFFRQLLIGGSRGLTRHIIYISLKLIQGDIDQVDAKAHITWVQPRVLSRQQIEGLAGNLTSWIDKMTKLQEYVDKEQVPAF